jgi:hypothetical protein
MMLTGSHKKYPKVQTVTSNGILLDKIMHSSWWLRATQCVDSHYSNIDGVMLSDHLLAVTENIDKIFNYHYTPFLTKLFAALPALNIDPGQLCAELKVVSMLHDIGKVEYDKSKLILHPIHGHYTIKRHSIVSLYAALDILEGEDLLSDPIKKRIYSVIEEHDVSYGLFCEWIRTGKLPGYDRWKELNNKIDESLGVGLMYLLFFKLADTHGHWNITDVIWFYKQVNGNYFNRLGIDLPIPTENDIR